MMRERTASGNRGQTTKIWAAWSSVAFTQELPPLGSVTTLQLHWSTGVSLRLTLPLISLEIVEPSSSLRRRRTRRLLLSTIVKSYFGLPQLCPFQSFGMPFAPTGCCDQSSTTIVSAAHAAVTRAPASSAATSVRAFIRRSPRAPMIPSHRRSTVMFDKDRVEEIREAQQRWDAATARGAGDVSASFRSGGGLDAKPLYTPADLADRGLDYVGDIGFPGEYPYTRGIYPSMYRGRLWTMRQYAGFGTARETNERFRLMLERGMGGINVAFDLPTQHGYDSDDPRSAGEVGKVGVPVDSLRDLEALFDGIPLADVSPANAINAPAAVILAMYVALAQQQGLPLARLSGSTQNDVLKEFVARGTYIYPPAPSIRLVTDIVEYSVQHLPRWNFINVCGYHVREAGGTLVHEVAFALADAITYVQAALARGVPVDGFAPRFAFNFTAGTHFLEEAAKYRAMRRMWARIMRDRFGAQKPASWAFRTGAGTAAHQLTAQQPENNIVRVTLHSLAAILGGAQSLHTAAYDEALALPTERSVMLALRTQQVLAYESGAADVIDPLAGSYYVESMTDEIETLATALIADIERRGGMVHAIESGWAQQQIANAAWEYQREVEAGERVIVGVNRFGGDETPVQDIHRHVEDCVAEQVAALERLRASRDRERVIRALDALRAAAAGNVNLMPVLVDAVKAYATVGEICGVLREVFGEHHAAQVY
jgi:methylmalonyl-CoA mutase N-terminal domain/subunit